jgi:PKD repeat protein
LITPGFVNADQNGEARANLVTSQTASVTATSSGATSSLSVEVGALTLAATTTAPEVGVATNFTVTPASGAFSSVVIDFGDQTPTTTLNNVNAVRAFSHTYAQRGTYTVTATGTTVTGSRAVTSISVTVNDRAPLQVTLTPNPPIVSIGNATMQGIVAFTVAPSGLPTGVAVLSVNWDFGDGGGTTTTALTTSHRYITPGTYTARVVVRATNGQQSTAEALVRVNP